GLAVAIAAAPLCCAGTPARCKTSASTSRDRQHPLVRNTPHDFVRLRHAVARHGPEQMMLDLVVERPANDVGPQAPANVPEREYLGTQKVNLAVVISLHHPFVIRREHRRQVDAAHRWHSSFPATGPP